MESALLRTELFILAGAAMIAACTDSIRVEAPVESGGSYIWVAERGTEIAGVWVFDGPHTKTLPFQTGDRVTLLIYPEPGLAAALMVTGDPPELPAVAPDQPGRGLPVPESIYVGEIGESETKLTPADQVGALVAGFRSKDEAPQDCLQSGGCYSSSEIDIAGRPYCLPGCGRSPARPTRPSTLIIPEPACELPWMPEDGICNRRVTGCAGELPNGACLNVDDNCPTLGEFREQPAGAIFVRASATPGSGDGTSASPYASIQEALTRQPSGPRTIILADGEYEGPGAIDAGSGTIEIRGACPAQTHLVRRTAPNAVFQIDRGTVNLRSLRIETDADDGIYVGAEALSNIEKVEIRRGRNGVFADGRVELRGSRIVNSGASGVLFANGSDQNVDYSIIEVLIQNPGTEGVSMHGDISTIRVRDSSLIGGATSRRAFVGSADQSLDLIGVWIDGFQSALVLEDGATATNKRVAIADTSSTAVSVGAGASLSLDQAIFDEVGQRGLHVEGTISSPFRSVTFVRPGQEAMVFEGAAATTTPLEGVEIIEPKTNYAVEVGGSARVTIAGLEIKDPGRGGITVRNSAQATIDLLRIDQPEAPLEDGIPPYLICSGENSELTVNQVALLNASGNAIQGAGTCTLSGADVLISGANGHGILLQGEVNATFDKIRVEKSHETDLSTSDQSAVTMTEGSFGGVHRLETGAASTNWILEGRSADIRSFELEAGKSTGVKIGSDAQVYLKSGHIDEKAVAVEINVSRAPELGSILDEVLIGTGAIDLRAD